MTTTARRTARESSTGSTTVSNATSRRFWGATSESTCPPTFEAPDLRAALRRWEYASRPEQRPPDAAADGRPWRTWLLLGGRGAGKTRAGAEWIASLARRKGRLALVGPSLHDVREVMIEGPSGLRSLVYLDADRPVFHASRRLLQFDNGAAAYAFSAEDPESLRGPQFAAAWADEFCAWRRPAEVLSILRMGLRLGASPRLMVTTTPRPIGALKRLMGEASTVTVRSATAANADNLAPDFLAGLAELYGGTRLAAQELEGLVVEDEGALWRAADLVRARGAAPGAGSDAFEAVVVAVDPPVTAAGDACGIVAAGREAGRAYVLEDASVRGLTPLGWARAVAACAGRWNAARIVAEANQGGEMVRGVLAQAGVAAPVKLVHAARSKAARAAPVAALYEQGRVTHCGAFPALEEELMALGAEASPTHSPDRADALVWALTELMLGRAPAQPRVRVV